MNKLAIAALAAGAIAVTLTACQPDDGAGSSELRKNSPPTTSAPPTSERPRLHLPDIHLPRPGSGSPTSSAEPTTTPE
ncbi:hypothetical protein BJY24_003123 [Nocardia transvalensis]|uniref:Lipoprotein n=1 Tax=Nocardia transvalensis TaxID=37333 RepID=A0A7W9PE24_9NOCA|nr:hypothetical protein [Nocardia transvalensis]MBB5914256.1 hypothetical protein [Nocardia transvalensis]